MAPGVLDQSGGAGWCVSALIEPRCVSALVGEPTGAGRLLREEKAGRSWKMGEAALELALGSQVVLALVEPRCVPA